MQEPNEKKIHKLSPNILRDVYVYREGIWLEKV